MTSWLLQSLNEIVDDDGPGPESHVRDVGYPGGEVPVQEPLGGILGLPQGEVPQRVGHDEVADVRSGERSGCEGVGVELCELRGREGDEIGGEEDTIEAGGQFD